MPSVADTMPPQTVSGPISVTKTREVPTNVNACRLRSGAIALSVRDGDRITIVELTPDEARDFAARLTRFVA